MADCNEVYLLAYNNKKLVKVMNRLLRSEARNYFKPSRGASVMVGTNVSKCVTLRFVQVLEVVNSNL